MNTDAAIMAARLFKFAMDVEKASLNISLTDCEIYYVPHMPYYHREIWVKETLIIFFCGEFDDDYIGTEKGNVYLWLHNTSPQYELKNILTMTLKYPSIEDIDKNPQIIPIYHIVDSNLMIKMLDNPEKYLILR